MQANDIVATWLKLKGYKEPNISQRKALEAGLLQNKKNLVVIAPTASGKTGVAELALLQTLDSKQRAVYLVPSSSLVTGKEKEFSCFAKMCKIAGAKTSPNDWDSADIVITTFESFYRTGLIKPDLARNFSLAIVDEFHVLYDKLRGFNLEKVLVVLKELDVRIICLSATFKETSEIGEWLNAEIVEIPETERPVQIKHDIIDLTGKTDQNGELAKILLAKSQAPYIVFCTTKESTRARAIEMSSLLQDNTEKEKKLVLDFEKMLDRRQLTGLEQDLMRCVAKRVAFHHSGLDQGLKEYIERLYFNKEIDCLFATTGLAYGVNFPTKTAILCDLTFYDPSVPGLRSDVPVYMYVQMAGRAGRPGFEKEGYSYVVTKNSIERQYKAPAYLKGEIERAVSRIGHDEYFRKALLELIYSGRNTDKQIQQFFENTFHNYQSKKVVDAFLPFDLFDAIKNQMAYLYNNGLVLPLGGSGYKLTDFGGVVVSFLFWSFSGYELQPFVEMRKFLEKEGEVRADFDAIYFISKLFGSARLAKVPKKVSKKIEEFYENMGISDVEQAEYSTYAIINGWMQNIDEFEIERDFCVYSSQLPQVASEIFKLLRMYEAIARKMNFKISADFKVFWERVRYGVTEEELPFVKLKQIGRGTVRELNRYVRAVLKKTPWNYKGTLLEVLQQFHKDQGDKKFIDTHVKYIENVGQVRAERILNFIKQSQQK